MRRQRTRAAVRSLGALALWLVAALPAGSAPRAAAVGEPWWRKSFPPAASLAAPLPPVQIDPAKVIPDLSCGSLDVATIEDSGVVLVGWAYDPRSGAPANGVLVLDNGRPAAPPVHVFRERPDVAAALKNRRLAASGWLLWLPLPRVAPGKHRFEAYALFANGRLGRLAGTHSLDTRSGGSGGSLVAAPASLIETAHRSRQ